MNFTDFKRLNQKLKILSSFAGKAQTDEKAELAKPMSILNLFATPSSVASADLNLERTSY